MMLSDTDRWVGSLLRPRVERGTATTLDRADDGTDYLRHWEITGSEGERDAFDSDN